MTRTSSAGLSHTAATILIGRRTWAFRSAGMLLAAGSCAVSLAVLPATAQAQLPGRNSTPRSVVSTFCSHLPAAKVSSIVGSTVSLFEAVLKKTTLECIYLGKVAATTAHPIDEVVISKEPGIPASQLATRTAAEARIAAESPKGVKLIFTSLPSVGPTAFSWTYNKALNGGQLVGIADNRGTTGYGVALGGAAKTFGSAAGHVPVGERLLALDLVA
ncbi:MAG: hypothetical protein ABSF89_14510 [Acidimicrobiales bacterium]